MPCKQCGQLLWFLRRPLGEVVILTFFPGPIVTLDSIARVKLVTAAAGDLSRVVVNLSHLLFIPTVFLGMLVALHRRVGEAGGKLRLCGLNPKVLATFKITNLDRVFDIHANEQSRLGEFLTRQPPLHQKGHFFPRERFGPYCSGNGYEILSSEGCCSCESHSA